MKLCVNNDAMILSLLREDIMVSDLEHYMSKIHRAGFI